MTTWRPRQDRVVIAAYMVGMYMTVVDSTIIYTALPSLARGFHQPLAAAQWVTLSYLLSLAVMVPSSGWIGDRIGTKRTFLTAIFLFTGASVLCGVSGSLAELVLFRVVQGIGGGLILPVGQAMLFRAFPPERRAHAAGIVALGTALGPATGPVLGGILTTELSWRWCFFVNMPLGTAVLAIGLLFLAEHQEPGTGRLDVPGFFLAGGGLALLLYALSESPVRGWHDPLILITGCIGVVALIGLVVVELRSRAPMLNLRLLSNRIFRTTTVMSLCTMGTYTGYLFVMPEFLQQARGATALSSGLTTLPGAIGLWLNSQIAARLYHRIGPRRMAVAGLCCVITIFSLLGLAVGQDTSTWLIRLLTFTSGSGIAWCSIALQTASFATISSADTGRASALFNTTTTVAGGIGLTVLVTVISASSHPGASGPALIPAFHHAFLTAAAVMVVAALIALSIRDADAAATMRRRQREPEPVPVAAVPPTVAGGLPGVQDAATETG